MKLLFTRKTVWLASLMLCLCLQGQAQTNPTHVTGDFTVGPTDTVYWHGNMIVDSNVRILMDDGGTILFYGQSLKLSPGAKICGRRYTNVGGYWVETITNGKGTGKIIFAQPNPYTFTTVQQTLDAGYTTVDSLNTFTSITIDNPMGVKLINSDTRVGSDINFVNGHIYTNGRDLKLDSDSKITGYDQNKYIVTSGTNGGAMSHVVVRNLVSSFVFPIGMADNDYTPATITPKVENTVHVNVTDYLSSTSLENTNNSTGWGMQRTWNIYGDAAGDSTTVVLQHNSGTNQARFKTAANYVMRFLGNSWDLSATGASTAGVPAVGTEVRSRRFASLATSAINNLAYYSKGTADVLNGPFDTRPDFAVTYDNTPVTGNVATNDNVPVGTTYGTPVAAPGHTNPSASVPVMNADGSYSFVTTVPGEYQFSIPVCYQGVCVNELLEITTLDDFNPKNPPIINPDYAETKQNTPVDIPVLANDVPGTPGASLPLTNVGVIDNNPSLPGNTTAGGTATVNTDGSIKYTPPTGFTGIDTLLYKVCDNGSPSLCDTSFVIIKVDPTNSPNTTVAGDGLVSTPMSTAVTGNVLKNGFDPEGDTQYADAQNKTIAGKGTFVLNNNGTFTFTPVSGFTGSIDFPFSIYDNGSPVARDTATMHILVREPALQTRPDFAVTYDNTPVTGNVATNDNVPVGTTYGTPVAAAGHPNPSASVPVMNADGSYSFVTTVPGEYQFSIPVCYQGVCVNELLEITTLDDFNPKNPPIINPDYAETKQNTPVDIPVLANDVPGTPGASLPLTNVGVIDNNPAQPGNTTAGGTATVNTDGSIKYTPPTGFTGIDTLLYKVCDNGSPSLCDTSFVIIKVDPANSPNTTVAGDGLVSTPMSTAITGNVLKNGFDPEGDTQYADAQNKTIAGKGTFVLNNNGTFTFTPVSGFTGSIDFPFSIYDNGTPVARDTATMHILVREPALQTRPDFAVTYENTPVTGNVATNDNVPAGTTYGTPVAAAGHPNPSASVPVMNADGSYSFVTTVPGEYQFSIPVCYQGVCVNELLEITTLDDFNPKNPPIINPDYAETKQNTPVDIPVLANDVPGTPGASLPLTNVGVIDNNPSLPGNTTAGGTATVNTDGSIKYTPPTGFTGIDTLLYKVCDNGSPSLCDTSFVIIKVDPANSPNTTVAGDGLVSTPMSTAVTGNVLKNGFDPEGDTQYADAQNKTIAGKGTFVLNNNGTFTFTPVSGFTGSIDFPFSIYDNGSPVARDTATMHILVREPALQTRPDFGVTYINIPLNGNVATNDNVPVGTTYGTPVAAPGHTNPGTSVPVMNADGSYSFVTSVPGNYQFSIPICYQGVCVDQLLELTLLDSSVGAHNAPVINDDNASTVANTPVTIPVLANDQPATPGTSLPLNNVGVIDNNPSLPGNTTSGGTAVVNSDGSITYTPPTGFTGIDTIRYTVCDNGSPSMCDTAIVLVTVYPSGATNTTTANDDYVTTPKGNAIKGNVLKNDHDAEGDTQSAVAQTTTIAGKGTLVLAADGSYTFTPVSKYVGPVDFPYAIYDNGNPVARDTATLHIMVIKAPDFTPIIEIDGTNFTATGSSRDFIVDIQEIADQPSIGQVAFRIQQQTAFTISISPTMVMANVNGGTQVSNVDWDITQTSSYILCTLKPGKTISRYGYSAIGFTMTRNANTLGNSGGLISVAIVGKSGGDSNSANNSKSTAITGN